MIARTGMSRSWIYKEMKAGRFPPCVKVGSSSAWDGAMIDQWIADVSDVGPTVALGRGVAR